jgi:hypothetical protein
MCQRLCSNGRESASDTSQAGEGAGRQLPSPQVCGKHPWPDHIAQYNLFGYLTRNKKYQWLRRLLFIGNDYVDQHLCMKPCSRSSRGITQLVHDHVMDGWQNSIKSAATL